MELQRQLHVPPFDLLYLTSSHYGRYACPGPACAFCCMEEREEYRRYGVCQHLHRDDRLCAIYTERPLVCRFYPFLYVLFEGKVLLRPTLNCPHFTDNRSYPEVTTESVGLDGRCAEQLRAQLCQVAQASRMLRAQDVEAVDRMLSEELSAYLDDPSSGLAPFFAATKDAFSRHFGVDVREVPEPLTPEAWVKDESFGGCYINPNVDADHLPRPLFTRIRVTSRRDKVQFHDTRSSQFVALDGLGLDAGLDATASDMLSDYLHLGFASHLAYLPALGSLGRGRGRSAPPLTYLLHAHLQMAYVHTNLLVVARRYPGEDVGYPVMREVLALNDCSIQGDLNYGYWVLGGASGRPTRVPFA